MTQFTGKAGARLRVWPKPALSPTEMWHPDTCSQRSSEDQGPPTGQPISQVGTQQLEEGAHAPCPQGWAGGPGSQTGELGWAWAVGRARACMGPVAMP